MHRVFPLCLLITLSGCSLFESVFGDDDTIEGQVAFGFEESGLRPCGSSEQWWIIGSEVYAELQEQYRALGLNWYEPAYARMKGNRSRRGSYGHLGAYQREFEVEEVVELRLLEDGECELVTRN